jgi:hypothetical protein
VLAGRISFFGGETAPLSRFLAILLYAFAEMVSIGKQTLIGLLQVDSGKFNKNVADGGTQALMKMKHQGGAGEFGFEFETATAATKKELAAAFVRERRNSKYEELLHGEDQWLEGTVAPVAVVGGSALGGLFSEEEERELEDLNAWVEKLGFPKGEISFDFSDAETGSQLAVFDLAWPNGLQEELSQPVAVLLNEGDDVLGIASRAGFRCFTAVDDFKRYVKSELLGEAI